MVPKRLKIEFSHDPAIAFLAICRKELKSGCRRDWFTVFAAALFSIAKMGKQPKCPLMNEEMLSVNTVEYYSPLKTKDILTDDSDEP